MSTSEIATLAGGCFWCLEAAFSCIKGVKKVVPGYTGGTVPWPSYEQVCSGATGHAEAVQITYDPALITYRELLEIFFTIHDPTTPNRQGADVGTQYRSAIFYHSPIQKQIALDVIKEMERSGTYRAPIVTEVVPLGDFYPAEGYHRDYYRRNPEQAYCRLVISPKLARLRQRWPFRLKMAEE
ncbi:MAG: peptide-methionine (S)-S-oxide reductase MsrA [Dehalococcoidia bacterium]|nr:peptide-methionine (S)-S-oxide reductase MsrA [Dehalococcoidia bacterium]